MRIALGTMADLRSGGDNDRRRGTSPACALQDGACRDAPQHGRPGHRRRWVSRLTATIITGVNIATTRRRNGQSWGVGTPAVAACGLVLRRAPTRRAMVHRSERGQDPGIALKLCLGAPCLLTRAAVPDYMETDNSGSQRCRSHPPASAVCI